MFLVKRDNFNKIYIIKGLITALLFSSFIYLAYFEIGYKVLNTILGLLCLYLVLTIDKKALFYVGFFVGILWFYWIGNSFKYYEIGYLSPLIILFLGLVYGFLFYLIALYNSIYFRAFALFVLSFIHPFGFNWFIPELIFIDSYLPTQKLYFAIILISLLSFIKLNSKLKILAFLPLLFICYNQNSKSVEIKNPNIKISMPTLNIKQDIKWKKENLSNILDTNLKKIDEAIEKEDDLVVLPETAFPINLNTNEFLLEKLLKKSMKIDILTGALFYENKQFYNATYYFSKADIKIAKKVVLVPFGEKIPLPKILVDFINNTFYDGASDYAEAKEPTDFKIKGFKFRNAICYEATSDKIFENLKDVKYMIATSNNAWFTPSIEPTLQKLLLKYYAKKYNVTIFHIINGSPNYIVRP